MIMNVEYIWLNAIQIPILFVFGQESESEYYSYSYLVPKTPFAHLYRRLIYEGLHLVNWVLMKKKPLCVLLMNGHL